MSAEAARSGDVGPSARRSAAFGDLDDVERVCSFVLTEVERREGTRAHQGARRPPLGCRSASSLVRFFAERRLHRVPTAVARALVAWGEGFPILLLRRVPAAAELLELQSRGRRCVSLLPDDCDAAPHASSYEFAVHDLCHLDKFIDPEHHLGQVGFFACLHAASVRAPWQQFASDFDEGFRCDVDHVVADMNGSAVFLFAALKMKLKMAVRRRCNAGAGPVRTSGPLDDTEERLYRAAEAELFRILELAPEVAEAGRAISARRIDPRAALKLLRHFEDVGRCVVTE